MKKNQECLFSRIVLKAILVKGISKRRIQEAQSVRDVLREKNGIIWEKFPNWGGGWESAAWEFFPHNPVFLSENVPKALRACEWFECRKRFECSLPNQGGIMSHPYM